MVSPSQRVTWYLKYTVSPPETAAAAPCVVPEECH